MPVDIASAIKERELKLAEQDQSYEAKLERALATTNRQLQPRIDALRLIGPVMPILSAKHRGLIKRGNSDFVIANCRFCNPPPKLFKCPACDWECEQRWRMKLHNDINPKWCRDRAARKVRKWSRQA